MHGDARAAYAAFNLTNLTNNACFDRLRQSQNKSRKMWCELFFDVQILPSFNVMYCYRNNKDTRDPKCVPNR